VKTCVSCAHFFEQWGYRPHGGRVLESQRCKIKLLDPVTGMEGEPDCLYARSWPHHCGWEGRFWKAAPLPKLGAKGTAGSWNTPDEGVKK
jgi:hypothetical protein